MSLPIDCITPLTQTSIGGVLRGLLCKRSSSPRLPVSPPLLTPRSMLPSLSSALLMNLPIDCITPLTLRPVCNHGFLVTLRPVCNHGFLVTFRPVCNHGFLVTLRPVCTHGFLTTFRPVCNDGFHVTLLPVCNHGFLMTLRPVCNHGFHVTLRPVCTHGFLMTFQRKSSWFSYDVSASM